MREREGPAPQAREGEGVRVAITLTRPRLRLRPPSPAGAGEGSRSDLGLAAELDHPVRRDTEELGCVERQVGQEDEQAVAPAPEGEGVRPRAQLLAPDDERGFHQVEMEV